MTKSKPPSVLNSLNLSVTMPLPGVIVQEQLALLLYLPGPSVRDPVAELSAVLPLHEPVDDDGTDGCTCTAVGVDGWDGVAAADPKVSPEALVYDASKPALFTEPSEVNTTCMAPLAAETAAGRALPLAAIRSLADDDVPS